MVNYTLKEIKENISNARKYGNLTQGDMAQLLDITQPAYSYYETGDKPIPLNKIRKISEILSIPLTELLGEPTSTLATDTNNLSSINNNLERIANTLDKLYEHISQNKY